MESGNHKESQVITWNHMESHGITWNHMYHLLHMEAWKYESMESNGITTVISNYFE